MASEKFSLFLPLFLYAIVLISTQVHCKDEDENNLLQGINSYRTSLNLPVLTKNKKAGCIADQIADKLEDQKCTSSNAAANPIQLNNYPDSLDKCGIDVNRTRDGVVLPVCVPKLVSTLVLTNYTHGKYARYVNDSRYTAAGVGSEDDWMVLVLSTNSPGGDFAGANSLVSKVTVGHCLVSLLLGMLVYVIY